MDPKLACIDISKSIPRLGRVMVPLRMSMLATCFILEIGMAKPIPADASDVETMSVFIPMTNPKLFRRGPPEFPGFNAASLGEISCEL